MEIPQHFTFLGCGGLLDNMPKELIDQANAKVNEYMKVAEASRADLLAMSIAAATVSCDSLDAEGFEEGCLDDLVFEVLTEVCDPLNASERCVFRNA